MQDTGVSHIIILFLQDILVRGYRFSTLFINFENRRGEKGRRRQEYAEEEDRVKERRREGEKARRRGGEEEMRYLCGEERVGRRYLEKLKLRKSWRARGIK